MVGGEQWGGEGEMGLEGGMRRGKDCARFYREVSGDRN